MNTCKRIIIFFAAAILVYGAAESSYAQKSRVYNRRAAALPVAVNSTPIMVEVANPAEPVIRLTYSLPEAGIKATGEKYGGTNLWEVTIGNALQSGNEGEPVLPVIPVQVVIPAGYSLENISIIATGKKNVPGAFRIRHGEAKIPFVPGAKARKAEPLSGIYSSDAPYPSKTVELIGVQHKRGVAIAVLKVHPVIYLPRSGKLTCFESISFEVQMKKGPSSCRLKTRPAAMDPASLKVENPEALGTYQEGAVAPLDSGTASPLGICNPAQTYQYVIITADSIKNATNDFTVRNLIAQKRSRGISDTIVTTEVIYANYAGADNPEKIRNFIIDAYTNWKTDFILLGGDANIIPIRFLYCNSDAGADNVPSDLYYQCLDGNYNSNGNSYWGEPADGPGGSDVDLMSEVNIGRASAENCAEMSNFVYKTIAYENATESSPYLRKAIMVGEYLGFGGVADYATATMEEIRLGSAEHGYTTVGFAASPLFSVDTLYDSPTFTWSASNLISRMNSGTYSIYNHLGHANETYDMKLYNADADALTNNNFFFIYSQGCDPGAFDVDCFAEHLTTSTRHGAFAVVLNARYGWGASNSTDGPSQHFDRQFWDAYFGEFLSNLGALNAKSHEDNIWDISGSDIRWCMYETNLLGDPQTPLRGRVVGPSLAYSSHSISDVAGGNGDGLVNPGETIDLTLTVANVGTDSASGVTATVSSIDPNVTMVNGSTTFGTIQCCGATRVAAAPVRLSISSGCPTPRTIMLSCLLRDSRDSTWTSTFGIAVYTSSQISGFVRTLTGGNPVSGATVNFSGPISGSVLTNSSGYYLFGGIDGTYKVVARRNDYLPSDTQSVSLPPSISNINFQLARPAITFSPGAIKDTLACGDSSVVQLRVNNGGDASLQFTVKEHDAPAAFLRTPNPEFKVTTAPFVPRLNASVDNSAAQNKKRLVLTNDKTTYSYSGKIPAAPLGFSNILVCEEVPDSLYYYDRALNNLGLARTLVTTVASAATALTNGTPWDLVIINSYTTFINTTFLTALDAYVANGGKLIFADWGMDSYTTNNLLKTLGISFVSDFTTPIGFAAVDSSHPIFTYPNKIAALTPTDNQYNIDGEIVSALSGAQQLAAFSGYPASGAIVLNAGRTCIFNGFQSVNFKSDGNSNGKLDIIELLENEISYLSGTSAWLSADPLAGVVPAGGSCTMNIYFNAARLFGGMHIGYLDFTHNDPVQGNPVSVPCTLMVRGVKRLSVRPVSIDFGNVWRGVKDTLPVVLINQGNEATTVSSLSSDNGDFFSTAQLPLTVPPLDSIITMVIFSPSSLGPGNATMTINSNAGDNPAITVSCSGTGTNPPSISVSPSALNSTLNAGDSSFQTLQISNPGGAFLSFNITTGQVGTNPFGSRNILIIGDGGTEIGLDSLFKSAGFSTTIVSDDAVYTGTNPSPDGFAAIVLTDGTNYGSDMPAAGQSAISNYVLNGGGLITTEWLSYEIQSGRYSTLRSIIPFTRSGGSSGSETYTVSKRHPISEGVDSSFSIATGTSTGTANAGEVIITGSVAGAALVAAQFGKGKVVSFASAGKYSPYDAFSNRNMQKLMLNSVKWVGGSSLPWLSIDRDTGSVSPGSFVQIQVAFRSANLFGGRYAGILSIGHNAPGISSPVAIPCTLSVLGIKRLSVFPNSINFGTVLVGRDSLISLSLQNSGNDTTTVSSIASSNAAFTYTGILPIKVAPFGALTLQVRYAPTAAGTDTGNLTIISNAQNNPSISVPLQGTGAIPASISVVPLTVIDTVLAGASKNRTLHINNTGGVPLQFNIVENAAAASTTAYTYGPEHFIALEKGQPDTRVGRPVPLGSGGPDAYGYRWKDSDDPNGPAYVWRDIKSIGSMMSTISGCDDCFESKTLSFGFPFYGNTYSTIYVSSNGFITFGSGSSQIGNYPLPSTSAPANLIDLFHDDLNPGSAGDVYFLDEGNKVTVQFDNVRAYDGSGYYTFQAVLKNDGTITLYYSSLTGTLTGCTVGIQNATQTIGLTVAYNAVYLKNNLAVEIRQLPKWLSITPKQGTINPGSSIDATVSLNAQDLLGGVYKGQLAITHNAPAQQNPFVVPCTLFVDGFRKLSASPSSIAFRQTWVGRRDTAEITLSNGGTEATQITSISSNNPVFAAAASMPFTIQPGANSQVKVVFQPAVTGTQTGVLTIASNAEDNPSISVTLAGAAVLPPSIGVTPNQLSATLAPEQSTQLSMFLSNGGGSALNYSIQASGQGGNGDTIDILAWTTYTDMTGEWVNMRNAFSQYLTRYTVTTTTAFDSAVLESALAAKEVFLIPEQENGTIPSGTGTIFRGVLTRFLQRGGTIIYCCPGFSGNTTAFLSEAGLMSLTAAGEANSGTITIAQPGDSLFSGISGPFTMINATEYCQVNDNSTTLATYNGYMVVARKPLYSGRIITLGTDFYSNDSNWGRLLCNAVQAARPVTTWLTLSPQAGSILPGDQQLTVVTLNSANLSRGTYSAILSIAHNDPARSSPIQIPITLQVEQYIPRMSGGILSTGVSAVPVASGSSFLIVNLRIGSPVVGLALGNRYKAVLQ